MPKDVDGPIDLRERMIALGKLVEERRAFTPDLREEADTLLRFLDSGVMERLMEETITVVKPWNDPRFQPKEIRDAAAEEVAEYRSLLRVRSPDEINVWMDAWVQWHAAAVLQEAV